MLIHPITLHFLDPEWERGFRPEHDRRRLASARAAAILGILAMLLFLPIDPLIAGAAADGVRFLRLAVALPILLLFVAATYLVGFARWANGVATATLLATGSVNLAMVALVGKALADPFLSGQLLILLIGFLGIRIRWSLCPLPLVALCAGHVWVLSALGFSAAEMVVQGVFLALAGLGGAVGVYAWERQERLRYLDQLVIAEEQERLKVLNRELRDTAIRDPLTRLLNRRNLETRLGEALALARRHRQPFSCVTIDLDGFKAVNDRLGHDAGDRLLCRVAEALTAGVRSSDLVFRTGGDEFCLLLPNTPPRSAAHLVERILDALRELEVLDPLGRPVAVGYSAGCVGPADPAESAAQLLRRADRLLYAAKEQGKGLVLFEPLAAA